ncbi:MAG: ATP cone domain-containing protein [bacterium]|nr:ATP cone domain-containing protein [bacterium]
MTRAVKETATTLVSNATETLVVKASGKREVYNPEKLRESLLNSGASEKVADEVVEHISGELYNEISTDDIYRHAFNILKHLEGKVARSYSLRRAVMELGPSGFPFENFVAEIMKVKGFKTLTGQEVLGQCVPHEVDVVAWNEEKLIMIEAKFHNELGSKSDLKVALYIKARFDDLADNVFNYGGRDRKVTDSWLVTNTKFSSTAIHYGVCKNLTMIGWNYPKIGNLQEMIEEEALHPITCLTSLSSDEKKSLVGAGMVLCSNVRDNRKMLEQVLGSASKSQEVLNEIKEIC